MALQKGENFDIFLSFEPEIEFKALKLYDILIEKYELKVWIDNMEIKKGDDSFAKISNAISKSKLMICCITLPYTRSLKCRNEITLAFTNDKKIFALIFEDLNSNDINCISFAMNNAVRYNLFEDKLTCDSWSGPMFDIIISNIETYVGRRLSLVGTKKGRKIKNSLRKQSTLLQLDNKNENDKNFKKVIISNVSFQNESDHIQAITIASEERLIFDEDHKDEDNNNDERIYRTIQLSKLRCTSLFQLLSGFNRIIVHENRQRFYISSSYNRSIIVIDINGNWIERRNPSRLLKQPWGICLHETKNELYVGDNEKRCIFVFDLNFKLLRTFGENILTGFYDLTIDEHENEIYAANLYDSIIVIFDLKTEKIKRKIYVSTPSFVRVNDKQVFIVSTDYLYVLDKKTQNVQQTIKITNSDYMNGLYIDIDSNIYTTAHNTDENNQKSREVYLYVIRTTDKEILRKVNLGLTQVNDLVILNKRMTFLCDTHLDIFEYNEI